MRKHGFLFDAHNNILISDLLQSILSSFPLNYCILAFRIDYYSKTPVIRTPCSLRVLRFFIITRKNTVCLEIIGTPLSFDEIKILLMNTHVIDHETVHCVFFA